MTLETYNQILCCSTSLECKNLSKLIRNVDESKWEEEAGNICLPGICAKFYQNPMAMDTLLYKTGNKKIVECVSDCLWGNGMPLGDPACLDSTKWISQGILGQMLECIHSEVTQPRAQSYHQPPPSFTSSLAYKQSVSLDTLESNHSIGTPSSMLQTWLSWTNHYSLLIARARVPPPPLYLTQLLLIQTKVVYSTRQQIERHKWKILRIQSLHDLTLLGVPFPLSTIQTLTLCGSYDIPKIIWRTIKTKTNIFRCTKNISRHIN